MKALVCAALLNADDNCGTNKDNLQEDVLDYAPVATELVGRKVTVSELGALSLPRWIKTLMKARNCGRTFRRPG